MTVLVDVQMSAPAPERKMLQGVGLTIQIGLCSSRWVLPQRSMKGRFKDGTSTQ